MKTITIMPVLLTMSFICSSQDYQITFSASGLVSHIETVVVENTTQGTSVSLNGTDTLHLTKNAAIAKRSSEANIMAYPNPMRQKTNIIVKSDISGSAIIDIYDVSGRHIAAGELQIMQGSNKIEISGLRQGMYFVRFVTSNSQYFVRLISLCSEESNTQIAVIGYAESQRRTVGKNIVQMQYNSGDRLLLKGSSGKYTRIISFQAVQSGNVEFEFIACSDVDGNNYSVVTIDSLTWMVENLRTTRYIDSTDIPLVSYQAAWMGLTTPAYCWFDNDYAANGPTYGALYNWYAVNTGKLCPQGWHVATDAEWTSLTDYLGGENIAGGKLKTPGTTHWLNPNTGATNEVGFSALPGGGRDSFGVFGYINYDGMWWTSTAYWGRIIGYDINYVDRGSSGVQYGFSVRCVKD